MAQQTCRRFMKLLLDENLPKKLKSDFRGHAVFTVRDMGWAGKTNGILLKLIIENKFDAFVTFDKNMKHQQNFKKFPIPVLVLNADKNSYIKLKPLVLQIKKVLLSTPPAGPIEIAI